MIQQVGVLIHASVMRSVCGQRIGTTTTQQRNVIRPRALTNLVFGPSARLTALVILVSTVTYATTESALSVKAMKVPIVTAAEQQHIPNSEVELGVVQHIVIASPIMDESVKTTFASNVTRGVKVATWA